MCTLVTGFHFQKSQTAQRLSTLVFYVHSTKIMVTIVYRRKQFVEFPTSSLSCPMVGANCRGGRTADAKGWLKRGGGSRALVDSRGEVDMSERGMQDIARFGALRRDNTPSLVEVGLCDTVQSCS